MTKLSDKFIAADTIYRTVNNACPFPVSPTSMLGKNHDCMFIRV